MITDKLQHAEDLELTVPRVRWGCLKCGFNQGMAESHIPVFNGELNEFMVAELRRKVLRVHRQTHGCRAAMEDLRFALDRRTDEERHAPPTKTLFIPSGRLKE